MSPREGRRFGLTIGAAFLALGGLLWWRGHGGALVAAALGTLLALAGLAVPTRLGGIERAWTRLATALSKVTTPLFLAVAYFGVIAPLGVVLRLAGRSQLARRASSSSYWITRAPDSRRRTDMERLF